MVVAISSGHGKYIRGERLSRRGRRGASRGGGLADNLKKLGVPLCGLLTMT
jgi:hypothetical protein